MTETETYIQLLKKHDWTYDYSEDQRVWVKGKGEKTLLVGLQKELDKDGVLWNSHAPAGYQIVR